MPPFATDCHRIPPGRRPRGRGEGAMSAAPAGGPPPSGPLGRAEMIALLRWYAEAGVDDAVGETPAPLAAPRPIVPRAAATSPPAAPSAAAPCAEPSAAADTAAPS